MNAYETINDILVHLFNEIWELEEKAIITEEYKDISNNDMHIIEAIGLGKGNNMSAIAKKLNITVGSLTTSMNSLVNKKHPQGITLWMFFMEMVCLFLLKRKWDDIKILWRHKEYQMCFGNQTIGCAMEQAQ